MWRGDRGAPHLGPRGRERRRTRFAAFGCGRFLVKPQVVFLLLRAVALVAVVGEDGLDVFDEISFSIDRRWQFARIHFRGFGCRHEEAGSGEQKRDRPPHADEASQTGLHEANINARSGPDSLWGKLDLIATLLPQPS